MHAVGGVEGGSVVHCSPSVDVDGIEGGPLNSQGTRWEDRQSSTQWRLRIRTAASLMGEAQ